MRPRFTFNRSEKLHLQKDFKRVFKTGRRLAHPAVLIYVMPERGSQDVRRMGLVTSRRKVGGAVERNRIKRRLREIFRLNKHRLAPGLDIVLVPRPAACALAIEELKSAVIWLLTKAGIFKPTK